MSSFRFLVVLAALAAALPLTACTNSKTEWNSKITVEVETPHGLVSGSSVTRETASFASGALVPGEARGVLFFRVQAAQAALHRLPPPDARACAAGKNPLCRHLLENLFHGGPALRLA